MSSLQFPSAVAPWLLLHRVPGFSYRRFARLDRHAIDAGKLLLEQSPLWLSANLPQATFERILALRRDGESDPLWQQMLRDVDCCQKLAISVIRYGDAAYPTLLQHTASAPPLLFVRGRIEALLTPQLAIVGARSATAAGNDCAASFARGLSKRGLTITSGLALGIDTAAHEGALAAGGLTIAALGTGIDSIYPRGQNRLAAAILEQGALVSELPIGTPARRQHFPQRNRLISGLSHGVLVVEAAVRSGSLITAHFAVEQGRTVFAIPGSIHNPLARGCHALIRNGARLVETIDDIVEELEAPLQLPLTQVMADADPPLPAGIGAAEAAGDETIPASALACELFSHLDTVPVAPDLLLERSGLSASELSCALLELELLGLVQVVAGGYRRHSQRSPTCMEPASG
jgi:DNA processing protein